MQTDTTPQLAPPGAGLPLPELVIARLLFKWRIWTGSRERFTLAFARERERIRTLLASSNAAQHGTPVLIARPRGLEDSSRFWSVWMTLDHLRIVHHAIARTLRDLAAGKLPERKASTAAVKPAAAVDASIVAAFEESCDALNATVESIPDLRTALRHDHPWFGPLDGNEWHALAAGHMRIHREQIERILAGLPSR